MHLFAFFTYIKTDLILSDRDDLTVSDWERLGCQCIRLLAFYIYQARSDTVRSRGEINRVHITICDEKQPCLRGMHGPTDQSDPVRYPTHLNLTPVSDSI